jgi:hypothetical protein
MNKTEYKFLLAGLPASYIEHNHMMKKIQDYCLDNFGGYTVAPCQTYGAWKDPKTGTIYQDTHVTLYVALEQEWEAEELERYLAKLLDQIEIYTVKIGTVL